MEEPITKSQAYQLFGKLYNKTRDPEHQKKVEEIVSKYSDIYVRIKKIQELDQQFENNKKPNKLEKNIISKQNNQSISINKQNNSVSTKAKKETKNRGGFLQSIFKGGDIAKWGEETGTLVHGLFGLNLKLSQNIIKTFDLFEEQQIIDAIKTMTFFIQRGWDDFPPRSYNIIVTLFQFFKEYINVLNLLKKIEDPGILVQQTLKMQVMYANLILFPDYKSFIENDFINWIKNQKDILNMVPNTISVVRILANLENRRPKFTEVITAFYVLERKKILTWNDIIKEIGVKNPVVDRYRAPEKILTVIHQKIDKVKLEIEKRENTIKDINYIKSKYFLINESGKINMDFLNTIVSEMLKRQWGETRVTNEIVKNHIAEPHRLLNLLLQDFDYNFTNFFVSSISIQDQKGQSKEVAIFKPNVFKKEIELYTEINQDLQEFLKQYKNAQMNFQNYYLALKAKGLDIILQNFIKIANKSCTFFRKMIISIRTILDNHEEAISLEQKGKMKEGTQRTKILPIEDLIPQPRFIPYYDYKIASPGRIHDITIKSALEEVVKDFYNYLYLYRDKMILENLSATPRLKSEIEIYKKKLLQYGIDLKN